MDELLKHNCAATSDCFIEASKGSSFASVYLSVDQDSKVSSQWWSDHYLILISVPHGIRNVKPEIRVGSANLNDEYLLSVTSEHEQNRILTGLAGEVPARAQVRPPDR
jgi:hypothetical protein